MKRVLQVLVVVGMVMGVAGIALAQGSCPICGAAESDSYPSKSVGQLSRGVANVGLGWVELFAQPVKEVKGGGNVVIGMGKGVGHTCLRMVQGAGEIITCPMPRAKDGKYTTIAQGCPLGAIGMVDR